MIPRASSIDDPKKAKGEGLAIDIPNQTGILVPDCVSPSVKSVEKGETLHWTLGHQIVAIDGVPDDLKSFKQNLDKKAVNVPASNVFQPKKSARSLSWNINVQIPNSNFENIKMAISPGQVTQFAEPVPLDQISTVVPKTQKSQKRVLSYRNAISASGVPASFYEWARMLKNDHTGDNYDNVDFSRLARSDQVQISEGEREKDINENTWDAILFATDDDYLSSTAVRRMFLENAINSADSKLFEMKEYTGDDEAPRTRDVYIPEQPMCELM
jgi:hypothetical protein